MNPLPKLIDKSGRLVPLDRQIASGGEGAVYSLTADSQVLAKVYHKPPSAQTVEKLTVMVGLANANLLGIAAWPTGLLLDAATKQVAGFVMPRIANGELVQRLYNPAMRLKHFPQAGWTFQVRAALNIAAAMDEIHKVGCVIGDVNESNLLVLPSALVRLIDCDSFQVRANGKNYLCEVGKPYYTAPELQGKSLSGLVRTPNHDRFGLAVLIYQLLFVGRHPYMGVYSGPGDPSFEELIREFRFAQGPQAKTWHMAPPRHTPTFDDIPPDLSLLFRRSFERGSEAGNRPQPSEWIAVLKKLEADVATCATDSGHKHWRGQNRCVWCRLADAGGPEYYFGLATGGTFAVDEARLREVLNRLAVAEIEPAPNRSRYKRAGVVGQPLPETAQRLQRAWIAARTAAQGEIVGRQADELREVRLADSSAARAIERLNAEQEIAKKEWTEKYRAAKAESADRWAEWQGITVVLAIVTGLSMVAALIGLAVYRPLGVIGGLSLFVFGGWLMVHVGQMQFMGVYRLARLRLERDRMPHEFDQRRTDLATQTEQARRAARATTEQVARRANGRVTEAERAYRESIASELRRRKQGLQDAEREVVRLERMWADQVEDGRRKQAQAKTELTANVIRCRALDPEYQAELMKLSGNTEAVARARFLRLHRLDDADISGIGAARKRALATNGIHTAQDVTWDAVRNISGFGDALTQKLVDWRQEVERGFRFDPNTGVGPPDRQALAQRFRTQQDGYFQVIHRVVEALNQAPIGIGVGLEPQLRQAVGRWELAAADVQVCEGIAA